MIGSQHRTSSPVCTAAYTRFTNRKHGLELDALEANLHVAISEQKLSEALMLRGTAFLVTLYVALVAGSVHAAPCAGFDDVDDATGPTADFCEDVTWIRNRGVTLGCTATQYCPFQFVSRLQMAAFMHRLGESLFPSTCASGQVMKWNGSTWGCANDNGGGSGSVTSVAAGTGLQGSPNPITGAGSLNIAASYQLPQACASAPNST